MTWNDIQGWCDYEQTYIEAVARVPSGGTMVEVGCYLGKSLCLLGSLVKLKSDKAITVIGVDTCLGSGPSAPGIDPFAEANHRGGGTFVGELYRNVLACGVSDVVNLLVSPSERAAKLFPDFSLDFVFIDAAHDFDSVCKDIRAWLPKIKPGGVLAGDDAGVPGEVHRVWPGVEQAANKLLPGWRYTKHDCFWWDAPK